MYVCMSMCLVTFVKAGCDKRECEREREDRYAPHRSGLDGRDDILRAWRDCGREAKANFCSFCVTSHPAKPPMIGV